MSLTLLAALAATGGFLGGWWLAAYLMLTRAKDTTQEW